MQLIGPRESDTLGSRVRRQICLVRVRIVSAYGRFTLSRYSHHSPSSVAFSRPSRELRPSRDSRSSFSSFLRPNELPLSPQCVSWFACDWRYLSWLTHLYVYKRKNLFAEIKKFFNDLHMRICKNFRIFFLI